MSDTSDNSGSGNPSGKSQQIGAILATASIAPAPPETSPVPPAVPQTGAAKDLSNPTRLLLSANTKVTIAAGGPTSTKKPPTTLANLGPDSLTLSGQVHCNPAWLNNIPDERRKDLIAALNTQDPKKLKPFCSSGNLRMRTTDQIEDAYAYLVPAFTKIGKNFDAFWTGASFSEQTRAFDVLNSGAYKASDNRLTQAIDFATEMGATKIGDLVSYMEFFSSKCEEREDELIAEKTLKQHCWKTVGEFLKKPTSSYRGKIDGAVVTIIDREINAKFDAAARDDIANNRALFPPEKDLKSIGDTISGALPADGVNAFLVATSKIAGVGKGTRKTFRTDARNTVDGEMAGVDEKVMDATKKGNLKGEFTAVLAEVKKVGCGQVNLTGPLGTDGELATAIIGKQSSMTFAAEAGFTYHVIKHHDELSAEGGGTTPADMVNEYIVAARKRLKSGNEKTPAAWTQGGARKMFFVDGLSAIIVVAGTDAFFATFFNM